MERWRDGEMERWRDGEMERWRDGERERKRKRYEENNWRYLNAFSGLYYKHILTRVSDDRK